MPAPGFSVNSGSPQDPVSPQAACAKDARKAEAREFGLAGVLWGELEGACGEGMPVVSLGYPRGRRWQGASGSGFQAGGSVRKCMCLGVNPVGIP